jgi:hypothetical protein
LRFGLIRDFEIASDNFDGFVKSLCNVMPDLIRHPEPNENTGFRVKPGMTKKSNLDFLGLHQFYFLDFSGGGADALTALSTVL